VVDSLPSKPVALSSNPLPPKKEKKKIYIYIFMGDWYQWDGGGYKDRV
jgi:hypothetical protein